VVQLKLLTILGGKHSCRSALLPLSFVNDSVYNMECRQTTLYYTSSCKTVSNNLVLHKLFLANLFLLKNDRNYYSLTNYTRWTDGFPLAPSREFLGNGPPEKLSCV